MFRRCSNIFLIIFVASCFACCPQEDAGVEEGDSGTSHGTKCSPLSFASDSFVCVCDESYCDVIGEVSSPDAGKYKRVISSRDSFRFDIAEGAEELTSSGNTVIVINHEYEYQSMLGFGGAFTDSTGINLLSLSEALQDQLLRSYFSPSGIEYNVGRIPIAGSDFSTYAYSYDEVAGDVDLEFFALTYDDFNYKIPLIQKAIEMSNKEIRLFGSPWSPPSWMKVNGMLNGTGGLLPEMRDSFANYLIKFVEAYESYNITIWGITPQNEPLTGFEDWAWNTCAWTAEDMRDFIKNNLGPAFTAAGLRRVQIMLLDHNRDALPWFASPSFEDPAASQYIDGVAVHWYGDSDHGPEYLRETNALFPDKFLLYTEACDGWFSPADERVVLGSWQRAENYAANIIEDVNNFVTGWVDWNMALSLTGGPNWASNYVDSPIIVDPSRPAFYKQPMFYAMGHFSKFIPEGSKRIYSHVKGSSGIKAAAFHTHNDGVTVVVLNTGNSSETVSILNHEGSYINFEMNPKSLETILFSCNQGH